MGNSDNDNVSYMYGDVYESDNSYISIRRQEYEELLEADEFLNDLFAAGLDATDVYQEAIVLYNERNKEDD